MVFIVDVRRGNLQLHLMYKALFELSTDRADFVSRLFSKKRPAGLTAASTAQEIFAAYEKVETDDETLYKENLTAIDDHLVKTRGLQLTDEDLKGIEYVYYQFFGYGPSIQVPGRRAAAGAAAANAPTFADLMMADDGNGTRRGASWPARRASRVLKELETKNLLVPVVGNFGGPKALRGVGAYVRDHGAHRLGVLPLERRAVSGAQRDLGRVLRQRRDRCRWTNRARSSARCGAATSSPASVSTPSWATWPAKRSRAG